MKMQERKRDEKSKIKEMIIAEASDFFDEHDIFEFEDPSYAHYRAPLPDASSHETCQKE